MRHSTTFQRRGDGICLSCPATPTTPHKAPAGGVSGCPQWTATDQVVTPDGTPHFYTRGEAKKRARYARMMLAYFINEQQRFAYGSRKSAPGLCQAATEVGEALLAKRYRTTDDKKIKLVDLTAHTKYKKALALRGAAILLDLRAHLGEGLHAWDSDMSMKLPNCASEEGQRERMGLLGLAVAHYVNISEGRKGLLRAWGDAT